MRKKPTNKATNPVSGRPAKNQGIDLATLASLLNADRPHAIGPATVRRASVVPAAPHVIAFLAASPAGMPPLWLGEECAAIQRELKLAPYRDEFRVESRWAITIDDLVRHLNELDPAIIHLSGHGGTGGVILQDDQGRPAPVTAQALAMVIKEAARNARVVLLNACWTAAHADALRAHIDVVIAMEGAIGDDAARMFAARFYGALASRRSITNAVAQGVATLAAKGLPEAAMLRCVTRTGVDADRVVLSARHAC